VLDSVIVLGVVCVCMCVMEVEVQFFFLFFCSLLFIWIVIE